MKFELLKEGISGSFSANSISRKGFSNTMDKILKKAVKRLNTMFRIALE
jgi:hypothetical protein